MGQRTAGRRVAGPGARRARAVGEWIVIAVAAVLVAQLVRGTVVQSFYIPSPSMVPTLKLQDRILVDKVTPKLRDLRRGEIIVFRSPPNEPDPNIKDLIKRIVGLPGETIEARDGVVFINGQLLSESYLPKGTRTDNLPRQVIPVDTYWMMGDNRGNSADSRVFGPVDAKLVVGRAVFRVWPVTRVGRL